uniref:Uncharacterized protein n=1 Tax=Myotis myotis TaxID=51298 RepID=A0A7J7V433_MYOMY|nr:hypothetical protein mMyoMyo1_008528 [Myotis myotis]
MKLKRAQLPLPPSCRASLLLFTFPKPDAGRQSSGSNKFKRRSRCRGYYVIYPTCRKVWRCPQPRSCHNSFPRPLRMTRKELEPASKCRRPGTCAAMGARPLHALGASLCTSRRAEVVKGVLARSP